MNELAEHLIIKGKNTFACLYVCLHSKICKNTLYYMRFFEILHKELNTQKFMNLFPMWSFCNSSRCARTISHKDRNMHKHTHAQTHTYKCTLTQTHIPWRSGKTLVLLGRRSYRSQVRALVMEGLQ